MKQTARRHGRKQDTPAVFGRGRVGKHRKDTTTTTSTSSSLESSSSSSSSEEAAQKATRKATPKGTPKSIRSVDFKFIFMIFGLFKIY